MNPAIPIQKPLLTIDEVLARPLGPGTPANAWRADRAKPAAVMFAELVEIEPRLKSLLADARAYKRASKGQHRVCVNERWYGYFQWRGRSLKDRLEKLVGWFADKPLLRTEDAYDVAYDYIYRALPHCRNCLCVGAPQEPR